MKRKLSKEAFDKLSESDKAHYKLVGSVYRLNIETDDDDESEVGEALRARDHEREEKKEKAKRVKELEAKIAELEAADKTKADDKARQTGDVAAVEKSWSEKYSKLESDRAADTQRHQDYARKLLIDSAVGTMTAKISKSPKLLEPHVRARLTVDFDGPEPMLRVLDTKGKLSATSLAELENEFLTNSEFASIMLGSKSSGGAGANNQSPGVPAGSSAGSAKATPLSKMSRSEQIAYLQSQQSGESR